MFLVIPDGYRIISKNSVISGRWSVCVVPIRLKLSIISLPLPHPHSQTLPLRRLVRIGSPQIRCPLGVR